MYKNFSDLDQVKYLSSKDIKNQKIEDKVLLLQHCSFTENLGYSKVAHSVGLVSLIQKFCKNFNTKIFLRHLTSDSSLYLPLNIF